MNLLNSQDAAQLSINNFHRVEINVGFSSGKPFVGQYVPEIEGTSIYVERCDFPFLFTYHNQKGSNNQAIVLRDGLMLNSPFKGFTVSLPDGVQNLISNSTLSLIVCKNGAVYDNNLQTAITRLGPSFRAITSTSVSQTLGIYIPPGVRAFDSALMSVFGSTTITLAQAQFVDSTGTVISGVLATQNVGGSPQTYNGASVIPLVVNGFVASHPKIIIPTGAVELQMAINGTGLTSAQVYGNFE